MIDPISLIVSVPPIPIPTESALTGLRDKYIHYLDTISNLNEKTASLLEKTREVPFCADLTLYEALSYDNDLLQIRFKNTISQIEADRDQLNQLSSPTPVDSYYEKNFTETIENMHDALQEHTQALRGLNEAIATMKDKVDAKVTPSTPPKNQTRHLRVFSFQDFSAPASPTTPSAPVLVRAQTPSDISSLSSPTSTSSQDSSSPSPLTNQATDVFATSPAPAPLSPSTSATIQSLRRRDTDVTLLQNPIFLEKIERQAPPTSPTFPPPLSLSRRLWRATRSLFSLPKKTKHGAGLLAS